MCRTVAISAMNNRWHTGLLKHSCGQKFIFVRRDTGRTTTFAPFVHASFTKARARRRLLCLSAVVASCIRARRKGRKAEGIRLPMFAGVGGRSTDINVRVIYTPRSSKLRTGVINVVTVTPNLSRIPTRSLFKKAV